MEVSGSTIGSLMNVSALNPTDSSGFEKSESSMEIHDVIGRSPEKPIPDVPVIVVSDPSPVPQENREVKITFKKIKNFIFTYLWHSTAQKSVFTIVSNMT